MTSKEKAKEIIEKFSFSNRYNLEKDGYFYNIYAAKESALICIDEILNTCVESMIYYWQDVKKEIEKL